MPSPRRAVSPRSVPRSVPFVLASAVLGSAAAFAVACGGSDGGDGSGFSDQDAAGAGFGGGTGAADGSRAFAPGDGGAGDAGGRNCAGNRNLVGVVRDFREFPKAGHPDFQRYMGFGQKRMVLPTLGADGKPQLNPEPAEASPGFAPSSPPGKHKFVTSPESFAQWYRDVPGVNVPLRYELVLVPGEGGVSTFASTAFFPADGQGFGNQDRPNNYAFTFELHTEFRYRKGDVFTFRGDDDLWTFVNGRLAIDLGGLHEPLAETLDLDARAAELGIEPGGTYALDVFHAERHTDQSNFRIDTTIEFTNCDPILR